MNWGGHVEISSIGAKAGLTKSVEEEMTWVSCTSMIALPLRNGVIGGKACGEASSQLGWAI